MHRISRNHLQTPLETHDMVSYRRSQISDFCRLRSAADVTRAMQAAGRGGPTVADHRGSVAAQRKTSHMAPLHHAPDGLPGERFACALRSPWMLQCDLVLAATCCPSST